VRRGPAGDGVRLTGDVEAALVRVAREGRGRAVAILSRRLGDIDRAEDALQDALAAAAERWPREGLPANPEAWILTTARNRAIDRIRRERTRAASERARARIAPDVEEALDDIDGDAPVPDERLALIFACCHPALAPEAQVPLTLRLVAGMEQAQVARALLLPEATVAQRIVRAKRKIRDAGIPISEPPAERLPERLDGVLTVVYLIYTEGHVATSGDGLARDDVASEAIRLGEALTGLMPDEAEPAGLLALMLLHHARRAARTAPDGALVLLADQDRALWDAAAIARGRTLVERALRMRRPAGPYALQAAIAAVHADAPRAQDTDWDQIVRLYDALLARRPTAVVALNRAVAVGERDGPGAALPLVDALAEPLARYAPLHAARAETLRRLGREQEARAAFTRAASLTRNAVERAHLTARAGGVVA
jgi:RNA polymerase sigma-70 factor (ECF subfamily)